MQVNPTSVYLMKTVKNLILGLSIMAYNLAGAESPMPADKTIKRITTLWSDKQDCMEDGALIIAIETYGSSYKVAACVKYGCRIAVPEFGKRSQQLNYRQDPKFKWQSETVFEAVVYGKNRRFYACDIDIK